MAGIDIQLKSVVSQSLVVRLRQTLGESAEFRNGGYWPNLSDADAPASRPLWDPKGGIAA